MSACPPLSAISAGQQLRVTAPSAHGLRSAAGGRYSLVKISSGLGRTLNS
jgi:hypothetical protein